MNKVLFNDKYKISASILYCGFLNLGQKIDRIKNLCIDIRNIYIQVNGGINVETAYEVIKAGVNVLVLETAIFKSENPSDVVQEVSEKFSMII